MAADSRLEILMETLRERLEGIIDGGALYNYSGSLRSVQRYTHRLSGEVEETNQGEAPRIVLTELDGRMTPEDGTSATFSIEQDIDILFILKDRASSSDLIAALDDVKRALFTVPWEDYGVGARLPQFTWRWVNPETAEPLQGLHFTFTVTFDETIGDPTAG